MTTETLERTIGQKPPNVVSQTVPVQCKTRAAPSPSANGSSANTTALDFASCSFNQAFIPGLPDDATDRDRACMPRMFIPATIIPPIGRRVTVLTYCALTMAEWNVQQADDLRRTTDVGSRRA